MKNLAAWTLILIGFFTRPAFANICGTDYQNFNPTTNGLDFVTVQSSETLKPCFINGGLFLNYAANSLTYSKTLNTNFKGGQKGKDRTLGLDLSLGTGLTDRWDIGINVPFIVSYSVQDDYYVSSFQETGATEVKMNTKYKLLGDEKGGVAAIISVNKNLIEDNPFAGRTAGLTWNYELAADTTFANHWAAAINVGYRDRNPGAALTNTPFVPMEDQWIYSAAGSYLVAEWDTKIILEVYGSKPAKGIPQDTERSLNTLEGLAGIKYDASPQTAIHFGATTQLDKSMGGADWRVYAGLNWVFGPVCKTEPPPVAAQEPEKPIEWETEVLISIPVSFKISVAELPEDIVKTLEESFMKLIEQGYTKILVSGHTDSLGPDAFNMDLSQRRADFVRKHLIEKFKISPDKIDALGFGPTRPVADNGNYQGRHANRRVDIKIWRETQKK